MMKQLLLFSACLFIYFNLSAQAPQAINYQGVARNASGSPVVNSTISLRLSIVSNLPNGNTVYTETHTLTTNAFGLFTAKIGKGVPENTPFSNINWETGSYFLKIEIDLNDGNGFVKVGDTSQLVSVPYALHTNTAEEVNMSGDISGNSKNVTVQKIQGRGVNNLAPKVGDVLKWDGTQWTPQVDNTGVGGGIYNAGTGIDITGNTITNTGDVDPNDDMVKTTNYAGDVSGTYNIMSVDKIKGQPLSGNFPTVGQILKWDGVQWTPQTDNVGAGGATYIAGAGITISGGNEISNTGLLQTTIHGGDVTGTYTAMSVDKINGREVSTNAPTSGQALKWDAGTNQWMPMNDNNTTYTAGNGISIAGTTISNMGDLNGNDDVLITTGYGGDVSGTYNNIKVNRLNGNQPLSGNFPALGQVLGWNGGQWTPYDVDLNPVDEVLLTTDHKGDVSGKYDNMSVDRIKGKDISSTAPTAGQMLIFNSFNQTWEPKDSYSAGTGISISATNQISNAGDTNPTDDRLKTDQLGGDVTGDYTLTTVGRIQGRSVSSGVPATNDVLRWSGTQWVPTQAYNAGTGVNINTTTNTITNTGDTDPTNDLTTSTTFSGDVSGTYIATKVTKIQNIPVANTTPNSGNLLKYNGTQWGPSNTRTQVTSITQNLTGTTINNGTTYDFDIPNTFIIVNSGESATIAVNLAVVLGVITPEANNVPQDASVQLYIKQGATLTLLGSATASQIPANTNRGIFTISNSTSTLASGTYGIGVRITNPSSVGTQSFNNNGTVNGFIQVFYNQ